MNKEKYSELQDRLSDVERDLKAFIIETLKEYGNRISLNIPEGEEHDDNHYPVTSLLYGKNDYPRIRISDVYLCENDSIYADGIDDDTGEKREEPSIYSEQLADIFHFIGGVIEQNTPVTKKQLHKGQRVYWNDPKGIASGIYIVMDFIEEYSIVYINNDINNGAIHTSELETKITKVILRKQKDSNVIMALLPKSTKTKVSGYMECYMLGGLHQTVHYDLVKGYTVPATESECIDLLNELKQTGFKALEIIKNLKK